MSKENTSKTILHIANDYSGSKVYKQLCQALGRFESFPQQVVYTAVRDQQLVNRNHPDPEYDHCLQVIYSNILSLYTRINFYEKRRRVLRDLSNKVSLENVGLIHAHTWYSDGAIAYELNKKYGIPYAITIRNTDINLYYKLMLHLRPLGINILRNASRIIFISKAHHVRLERALSHQKGLLDTKGKTHIIPNGVDSFWLNNLYSKGEEESIHSPFRLLYIGNFSSTKNIPRLIRSIGELNKGNALQYHLTIVGGSGSQVQRVKSLLAQHPESITYLGPIQDKEELKKVYRVADAFVMPSLKETFGLVYVEALSQGLPVLYSRGEGIDGIIDEHYGISCNPKSKRSIIAAIERLKSDYKRFNINPEFISTSFDWDSIATTYRDKIYNPIATD